MYIKIIDWIWLIIVNFLIFPVTVYYCLMIERFLKVLCVNFKIRVNPIRFIVYFTAAFYIWKIQIDRIKYESKIKFLVTSRKLNSN